MEKKDLRIVYLGTPEFAVEPLRRLVEGGFNVVGVITAPDKPVGRHQRLQAPAVKEYAQSVGLPILQPERLKDEAFLAELRALKADLQIVVAFRMLPEQVWAMPRLGTFNIHASLLPQYRGAAPINWAIINGETETGLTAFFLRHDIDTGDIIRQVKTPIAPDATFGQLHDTLMHLSGQLTLDVVNEILDNTVHTTPQSQIPMDEPLRPAPKIFKDTCHIDIHRPLDEVYNFVRGLSPAPGAWANLHTGDNENELKIFSAEKVEAAHDLSAGTIVSDNRKHLDIAFKGGFLRVNELQLSGKKRMPVAAFLNGYKFHGTEHII